MRVTTHRKFIIRWEAASRLRLDIGMIYHSQGTEHSTCSPYSKYYFLNDYHINSLSPALSNIAVIYTLSRSQRYHEL